MSQPIAGLEIERADLRDIEALRCSSQGLGQGGSEHPSRNSCTTVYTSVRCTYNARSCTILQRKCIFILHTHGHSLGGACVYIQAVI